MAGAALVLDFGGPVLLTLFEPAAAEPDTPSYAEARRLLGPQPEEHHG